MAITQVATRLHEAKHGSPGKLCEGRRCELSPHNHIAKHAVQHTRYHPLVAGVFLTLSATNTRKSVCVAWASPTVLDHQHAPLCRERGGPSRQPGTRHVRAQTVKTAQSRRRRRQLTWGVEHTLDVRPRGRCPEHATLRSTFFWQDCKHDASLRSVNAVITTTL